MQGVRHGLDTSHALYAFFDTLLHTHVTRRWSVKAYARVLACSPRLLGEACMAARGQSAKALIDERLMAAIRARLVHTDDGLAQIAGDFQFSDTPSFVRFFKRMEHMTPGRYRQLARLCPVVGVRGALAKLETM
jgi:AraC family transcriptional activator of pobA